MKIRIAENIRSFRKAAGLTQEQLAEAVGVTVGAVSKWEAGLSNPDLAMIVKLADLFEISVDVLLGYDWKSMSMGQAAARIKELCPAKKYGEGRETAEKALLKYPQLLRSRLSERTAVPHCGCRPQHPPHEILPRAGKILL